AVAGMAGKKIKPSLLELGGSNSFIILNDADLDKAVESAVVGRFQNNGQSCIAAKRFLVQSGIYDRFVEAFTLQVRNLWVGDPADGECYIGPMARKDLAEDLHDQVERSLAAGANLLVGGRYQGAMYSPTILTNVQPGMAAFDEETFGPLAAITKVESFDEAIHLSNSSEFGLGVSVFTSDADKVLSRSQEFEDGALFINSIVKSDPRLPFGGTKSSGYGRELAEEGLLTFINRKTVVVA
ncbi:MAG: aldehyde dehydrogenase family protein, partial [Flavobacteriales bacterium]|nr:aldehyde dehydrogenase family protein [Flavobacteriales bacterium]